MEQVLLTFTIVAVFYLLIPGAGAFLVRSRWRAFRRRMLDSSRDRVAGYEQFRTASTRVDGSPLGRYRFFGALEAIQGDDTIWLRNGNVTIAADMETVRVHTLPPASQGDKTPNGNGAAYSNIAPQVLAWSRVGSLPEGTRFYVDGSLEVHRGIPVFRSSRGEPLLVVIYDGEDETVLPGSIWSGRQRNEYWNQFTPASLLIGSFALLILSYLTLRSPLLRLPVLFSLTLSSVPVLPLLPPGVILFFLYRYWWRKGRYFRAQRDLVRLPLRVFRGAGGGSPVGGDSTFGVELMDGSQYGGRTLPASMEDALLNDGAVLREVAEFSNFDAPDKRYVFGVIPRSEQPSVLTKPVDPMAEFVMYRQDPAELAQRCNDEAQRLEQRSGIALALCLLINGYEVFLVLSNLVR